MLDSQRVGPLPRPLAHGLLIAAAGAVAIAFAAAIGNPTPEALLVVSTVIGIATVGYILFRPFFGIQVMAVSMVILIVYAATDDRYVGAYDLVLPFVLLATVLGRTRADAVAGDRLETGPAHDVIRGATERFRGLGVIYFAMAAASLVPLAFRVAPNLALESLMSLTRCFQGALMFPLALWWIRTERQFWKVYNAIVVGIVVFFAINIYQMFSGLTFRAGGTWVMNRPDWAIEGANEAGYAAVVFWALVICKHKVRPKLHDFALLGILFGMLIMTQSRSSLIAFVILNVLTIRKFRFPYLLAGVLVLLVGFVLAPEGFWERMQHTLTFKRGSVEVYTFMIRVYGYFTSLRIFLDNWLLGVGYLGGRYVSHEYNSLQIGNLGAENLFLETATGLGIFGLVVVVWAMVRLFQLGPRILPVVPKDSMAWHMARYHVPLFAGLTEVSLTGTTFVGMVNMAQNLIWCALLIRVAHIAVNRASPPAGGAPS